MKIGHKLKDLRETKNLKQKEVALILGISPVTYNRYESDQRKPSFEIMIMISDYFDVDFAYFFDESYKNQEYYLFAFYNMPLHKLLHQKGHHDDFQG